LQDHTRLCRASIRIFVRRSSYIVIYNMPRVESNFFIRVPYIPDSSVLTEARKGLCRCLRSTHRLRSWITDLSTSKRAAEGRCPCPEKKQLLLSVSACCRLSRAHVFSVVGHWCGFRLFAITQPPLLQHQPQKQSCQSRPVSGVWLGRIGIRCES